MGLFDFLDGKKREKKRRLKTMKPLYGSESKTKIIGETIRYSKK